MSVRGRLVEAEEALREAQTQRDKLRTLIELGEELPEAPKDAFSEEDRVPGCASEAYVRASTTEGQVRYACRSTSLVIKGYLYLLLEALDNQPTRTIAASGPEIAAFLQATGLEAASIVPSRTNSFSRLYEFMKRKASELSE